MAPKTMHSRVGPEYTPGSEIGAQALTNKSVLACTALPLTWENVEPRRS